MIIFFSPLSAGLKTGPFALLKAFFSNPEGQSENKERLMKRSRSAAWSVIVVAALAGTACLAQGSPRGTAKLDLGGKTASVEYGRPSLKGRTMQQLLGRLKVGGFWRLGADDSTTFSTDADLAFG